MNQLRSPEGAPRIAAQIAALAAVAVVVAGWQYLSVPVLVLLAAYLVYPHRETSWGGRLLVGVLAVGLCWFVAEARTVFAPLVVAAILAYLGDPIVDWFEARRISRSLAILILLIPLGGGCALVLVWLGPLVAGELMRLIEKLPEAGNTVLEWGRAVFERIPVATWDLGWEAYLGDFAEYAWVAVRQVLTGALSVGKGLGAAMSFLSYAVLTPILTFYLLRDWDRILASFDRAVHSGQQKRVRRIARRLDEILGAYFRGQGLVCLATGALTAAGLLVLGVDFALLLGILTGLFNLVPVIGLIASVVPALAVAFLSPAPLITVIKVLAVFGAVQLLEQSLLSPRLVGDRVGLHPALVMLAILVFPIFMGFVGVLVAVPATAAIGVLFEELGRADGRANTST